MIIYGDYHTHTTYSRGLLHNHGKGSILDNATAAKEKGLKEIAITEHGFTHKAYGISRSQIENMLADIEKAKKATGVNILMGIEENFTSLSGNIGVIDKDLEFLDIINVGYHKTAKADTMADKFGLIIPNNLKWYTKKQIEKNTICVLKAIETKPINIITHLGVGMPVNVEEVAKMAKQKGVLIELNGKRISFTDSDMDALMKHDTMFILNSDAHSPEKVGDVRNGMNYVIKYHIPEKNIANLGKRPEFKKFK